MTPVAHQVVLFHKITQFGNSTFLKDLRSDFKSYLHLKLVFLIRYFVQLSLRHRPHHPCNIHVVHSQRAHVLFFTMQACSVKSLERLRSQQESLRSLQPQVVYLRDLTQGLLQDAPQTPGGAAEGAQRLQEQAKDTEKVYEDVTDKVRSQVKLEYPKVT